MSKRKPGKPVKSRSRQPNRNHRGGSARRSGRRAGAEIDPRKFVNEATAMPDTETFEPRHEFGDFGFDDRLRRNIERRGYTAPTRIQDLGIGPILEGRDLVGLANTGTGKTAAFVLPIIQRLLARGREGAALIITPTRELAAQIDDEFTAFAGGLDMRSALCVGGVGINRQIAALRRRPRVVIGTPGRLKDLVEQGEFKTGGIDVLVLDEADRMLDMGFIRDVRFLADRLPRRRQTLCFSATMTRDIENVLDELLVDPVSVSARTSVNNDHIEQSVIPARSKEEKISILTKLLGQPEFEKVLIFGRTKHGVQRLAENLTKRGLPAHAIHGNKSQAQRQRSLDAFKLDDARILVATDVASRGLDIPAVSHVINFDEPDSYDDYIHRIGRTGRAGSGGNALTFVGAS